MRVLFVSPFSNPRCGEAEYGRIWCDEMEKLGVTITRWDGYYPEVYRRGHKYMPRNAATGYDLIHLNWGPANLGHYLPQHIPDGVPLSVFLCDVPPHISCPLWDRANIRLSVAPAEGCTQIGQGVPLFTGPFGPVPTTITIGLTHIRDDSGTTTLRETLQSRKWELNCGDPAIWLSTNDEISRLSCSTFNVCWYHNTGRGVSMAAGFNLASRRPLLVSHSTMFEHLLPWEDEIYMAPLGASLNEWLDKVLYDIHRGQEKRPRRVLEELSWARVATHIKQLWESIL